MEERKEKFTGEQEYLVNKCPPAPGLSLFSDYLHLFPRAGAPDGPAFSKFSRIRCILIPVCSGHILKSECEIPPNLMRMRW